MRFVGLLVVKGLLAVLVFLCLRAPCRVESYCASVLMVLGYSALDCMCVLCWVLVVVVGVVSLLRRVSSFVL